MESFSDLFADIAGALFDCFQKRFDKVLKDSIFYSKRLINVLSVVLSLTIVFIVASVIAFVIYRIYKLLK